MGVTEQSRAERFLREFAGLEDHLRKTLKKDQGYPYRRLIEDMRKAGLVTDSQEQSLATFGYLRNALAHARESGGEIIADPRESAVEEFTRLASVVKSPPLLTDVVRHRVHWLDIDQPLNAFMLLVKQRDFSQVPILEKGRYVDMLTLGRLARWIAAERHYDWFDLDKTPLRQVLVIPLQKEERFAILSPDVNLAQALNLFDLASDEPGQINEVPVRGLLVIENGFDSDQIRALVTYEDLPVMLKSLGRGA